MEHKALMLEMLLPQALEMLPKVLWSDGVGYFKLTGDQTAIYYRSGFGDPEYSLSSLEPFLTPDSSGLRTKWVERKNPESFIYVTFNFKDLSAHFLKANEAYSSTRILKPTFPEVSK
jgi:hypothetical protein